MSINPTGVSTGNTSTSTSGTRSSISTEDQQISSIFNQDEIQQAGGMDTLEEEINQVGGIDALEDEIQKTGLNATDALQKLMSGSTTGLDTAG